MQTAYKAAAIRRFNAAHPDIQVIPRQVERDKKYEELSSGDIDLVFDIPQYYVLNNKIRKAGSICNDHCLMVHREHPLASKKERRQEGACRVCDVLGRYTQGGGLYHKALS